MYPITKLQGDNIQELTLFKFLNIYDTKLAIVLCINHYEINKEPLAFKNIPSEWNKHKISLYSSTWT